MLRVVAVSLAKASPVSPIPLFVAANTSNHSGVPSIMQDTFLKQGYGMVWMVSKEWRTESRQASQQNFLKMT